MIRWHIRQERRITRGSGGRVTGREVLLRGQVYLKNVTSTLRGRIASRGRSIVGAYRRRSAVAQALAHNLQGCSQQGEAAPRVGVEGVVMSAR